jgi:hypothetical protein
VRNRLYIERKWGATWLNLMPRVGFYLIRAARNGLLIQTMRAIPAAIRLSSHVTARRHPPAARNYLQLNDAAHRSHWATMVWHACRGRPRSVSAIAQPASNA